MSFRTLSATRALPLLALASVVGLYCGVEPSPPSTSQARVPLLATWSAPQKILANDKARGSTFGFAMALSRDGNTALVGSPGRSDGMLVGNGAAYVLTRSGSTWTEQQKLNADDLDSSDSFGYSVALSRDGNTAIVGARNKSDVPMSIFNHGAAYVFTRSGTTWTQQQKLTAMDRATNDTFGYSVAMSGDGNTVIIGARGKSDSPTTTNGAAYVFSRSNDIWTPQQKIHPTDRTSGDLFGGSVSLSDDASAALISAESKSDSPNSGNGAAYIFKQANGSFSQAQKLNAADRANSDRFGFSGSMAADGKTVLIGARTKAVGSFSSAGVSYVFSESAGSFTQQAKLVASDAASSAFFGFSVALSGSGNTALIGSSQKSDSPLVANGAAYLFTRSAGSWTQLMKMSASDAATGDLFGQGVALSRDGSTAVIAAPQKADEGTNGVGAVYIYVNDGSVDGISCTADTECLSGSCADGVCCDFNCNDATDCRSCLNDLTGAATGTCGRISAAMRYTCRSQNAAKLCDIAEVCNGLSDSCPADIGTPDTTLVCRSAATGKTCDVAEKCDGLSPDCPGDGFRAAGTVCRVSGGPCDVIESCSGASADCPPNRLASANILCKNAGANPTCDPADFCDGVRPLCPGRFAPSGTSCGNGMTCSVGLCR